MKKVNNFYEKVIAGVIATNVVITPSCVDGYRDSLNLYGPIALNNDIGTALFDISETNLSKQLINNLEAITEILKIILNNEEKTNQFCSDPETFLKRHGLNLNIEISEKEISLIRACSDKEMNEALRNRDFRHFLEVGYSKGYIGDIKNAFLNTQLSDYFNTEENYQEFLETVSERGGDAEMNPESVVCAGVVFAVVVAVAYAFAGAGMGAAAATLTVFHSVFSVKVAGSNNPSQGTTLQAKEPTLKIWTDNGNTIVYDEFYYEVIDKQVEELTKIILELFPNLDREYVENMIRINLEGYYGLRG